MPEIGQFSDFQKKAPGWKVHLGGQVLLHLFTSPLLYFGEVLLVSLLGQSGHGLCSRGFKQHPMNAASEGVADTPGGHTVAGPQRCGGT